MKAKILAVQALSGALGIGLGYWWFSPAHTAEELRAAEMAYVDEARQEQEAADKAALQGECEAKSVKALPSGLVAVCATDGRWQVPGSVAASGDTQVPN